MLGGSGAGMVSSKNKSPGFAFPVAVCLDDDASSFCVCFLRDDVRSSDAEVEESFSFVAVLLPCLRLTCRVSCECTSSLASSSELVLVLGAVVSWLCTPDC